MNTEALSASLIHRKLTTRFLGRNLVYLPETASTNDEARRLADNGAPDGTLVLTDYQSAGRGRLDRRWQAPAGSSLLLSLILRPALQAQHAARLTMLCALAAADAVEAETGLDVGLKWPNDVLIGPGKVGGILTELELSGTRIDYAIAGIGLNVNLDPGGLAGPLLAHATSLSAELGRPVDRLALLIELLARLEARYAALQTGGDTLQREWAARLVTIGRPVTVTAGDTRLEGIAVGVDAGGALLVRPAAGPIVRVVAGDVSIQP